MSAIKIQQFNAEDFYKKFKTFSDFVNFLSSPSLFSFKGKKCGKTRAIVTLLHGNEPSGLKALHNMLNMKNELAYDTIFIVASIGAAKTEPQFSHRMLPNHRDLNRCFQPPYNDIQGKLANSIIEVLSSYSPEWVLDIHNTSGSGPAFTVATDLSEEKQTLASYFSPRQIVTDIRLGSLMEADLNCPILTVEAGGAQDNNADLIITEGLSNLLTSELLTFQHDMELLHHPRRLELSNDVKLVYDETMQQGCDLCVLPDIEKYNFGTTKAGTQLAYVTNKGFEKLQLDNQSQASNYFHKTDDKLVTKIDLKLFMVTTRADIAISDCLFYFVVA